MEVIVHGVVVLYVESKPPLIVTHEAYFEDERSRWRKR